MNYEKIVTLHDNTEHAEWDGKVLSNGHLHIAPSAAGSRYTHGW